MTFQQIFGGCAAFGVSLAIFALAGCDQPADTTGKSGQETPGEHEEHAHPTVGPHQGHIIELGNEAYHAELTHDDAAKTVTVYLLDSKAASAVPIKAAEMTLNLVIDGKPRQVKLAAAPQAGDPAGESSAFSIMGEATVEALESPKTTGRLVVTIDGKSYSGAIKH
jgi:hypothetical protein